MGVRRKLLKELLASLKYIKNLTEQQISASLWSGKATLCDLELEPHQLQQLFFDTCPCGLEILEASVKELSIRIPWSRIMTQSVVVAAHNVEVRAMVHCEDEAAWREVIAGLQRSHLRKLLDRAENAPDNLSGPTGAFDQMRKNISDGMQIQVSSCTLILMSCHPRHFPCHGPLQSGNRPMAEILRVVGEDIMSSPSDPSQMPTDKIKEMHVYDAKERVLQLSKFIKCRSLRISPGSCGNTCPHAVAEFMENPVVLTCHVCAKYPSDGSRICPFLIGNHLQLEFCSTLGITACECQVRAVIAALMDIGRLEEWRTNKGLLETAVDSKPSSAESSPVTRPASSAASPPHLDDELSAAGCAVPALACLDELPDEDDNSNDMRSCDGNGDGDEGGGDGDGNGSALAPGHESVSDLGDECVNNNTVIEPEAELQECTAVGSNEPQSPDAELSQSDEPELPAMQSTQSTDSFLSPTAPWAIPRSPTGNQVEGLLRGFPGRTAALAAPISQAGSSQSAEATAVPLNEPRRQSTPQSQSPESIDVPQSDHRGELLNETVLLCNTSGDSLKMARGAESEHKHEEKPPARQFEGLRSAVELLPREFGQIQRDLRGLLEPAPLAPAAILTPAPLLDGEPLMNTSNVSRTFARGPEPRRLKSEERAGSASSAADHGHGSGLLEKTIALQQGLSAKNWKKLWAKGKEFGQALTSGSMVDTSSPSRQSGDAGQSFDNCENHSGELASEDFADVEEGDEQSANEEEDDDVFEDVKDYYSTGSPDAGIVGDSGPLQGSWLRPVLKWLGNSVKMLQADTGDWPEMSQKVALMGVGMVRLVLRITGPGSCSHEPAAPGTDSQTSDSSAMELCIDNLTWRAEVHMSLPAASIECIERLKNPAEDRGIVAQVVPRNMSSVGPWCLPVMQNSAQAMRWPNASLKCRACEHEAFNIDILRSCEAEKQPGSSDMISFDWQPKDAPPMVVSSTPWVLHTWPMHIVFNRACIVADEKALTFVKTCWARCKPFFSSKCPPPSLVPPQEPLNSGCLYPVECLFIDFTDCEVVEAHQERLISNERRWPLHVTLPRVRIRSHADILDFSQMLPRLTSHIPDEHESKASMEHQPDSSLHEGDDKDVTIPKAMFDHLVHRAAEATLQHSQVKAAREELQKAYIKLAATRSGAHSSSSSSAQGVEVRKNPLPWGQPFATASAGELERKQSITSETAEAGEADELERVRRAEAEELERLRRKCAQLESSVESQGLAHRRLEAELATYHELARNELRLVLSSRTAPSASSTANVSTTVSTSAQGTTCELVSTHVERSSAAASAASAL